MKKTGKLKSGLKYGMLAGVLAAAVPAGLHFLSNGNHGDPTLAYGDPSTYNPNIFVNLAKRVVPSVVNISTLSTVKTPYGYGTPDDMFRRFFEEFFRHHGGGDDSGGGDGGAPDLGPDNNGGQQRAPKAMSLGTGFIIDSSGLILTNNHVVAGADEIKIYFTEEANEKPTDGQVVGRDPEIDVALIRVKSKRKMVPLPLGDSDKVQVGEYVMAVGNPFGQGHSVTHGIISAKGRIAPDFPLARYLQTDAPINPGNSGGPLVDLNGNVIGINNAIEARAQGIGFAIPISLVKSVLTQLKTKGKVTRGFIGVLVEPLTSDIAKQLGVPKDTQAPFVSQVNPGEPAAKAGLKVYDVITSFNGKTVHSGEDLIRDVTTTQVGSTVPITIMRNGKQMTLQIHIAQRPGTEQLAKQESKPRHPKARKKAPPVKTGMDIETLTPSIARDLGVSSKLKGVVVDSIDYGAPADTAGIMRGDVIVEVDRKPVKNVDQFYKIVNKKKSYLLRVLRSDAQGHEAYTVVVLDLKGQS